MTKKEILQTLWDARFDEHKNTHFTYSEAMEYAHQLVSTMPDDEWIRFSDKMPTDEDYYDSGNGYILCANEEDVYAKTILEDGTGCMYTHWKRITLPSKPLPTKAEILDKFGISEEQLKEILQ